MSPSTADVPVPAWPWRHGWPSLWLPIAVLLYYAAFLGARLDPSWTVSAVALLLSVPLLMQLRFLPAWCSPAGLALLGGGLMVVWMAVQPLLVTVQASQWAWVGSAVMAMVAMAGVMSSPLPASWWLPALGSAATAALALALALMRLDGYPEWSPFNGQGFGNANFLINACSPPILGWAVWEALRREPRADWRSRAQIVTALAVLAYMAWALFPGQPRRGVQLAALMAGLVATTGLAWRWRRWAGQVVVGAAMAALIVAAAVMVPRILRNPGVANPHMRVTHYRAAIQHLPTVLPAGGGAYAALRLDDSPSDKAREQATLGAFLLHVHDEPLDMLLSAGLPGFAGWMLLVGACLAAAWWTADPAMRAARLAMAAALGVHLLTDNLMCYEGPRLAYAILAGFLLLEAGGKQRTPGRWRWALVVVPTLAVVVAVREAPAALLRYDGGSQDARIALAWTWRPQTAYDLFDRIDGDSVASGPLREEALALARRVIPDTGQMTVRGVEQARAAGRLPETVDGCLRLIHRRPFFGGYYLELARLVSGHPEQLARVPPRIQTRLAYLTGQPGLPRPRLQWSGAGMDEGADLCAALTWAIGSGVPWREVDPALHSLTERYAHVADVALIAIRSAAHAPPGAFPWLPAYSDRLILGLDQAPVVAQALFEEFIDPARAPGAWPTLAIMFPVWTRMLVSGQAEPIGWLVEREQIRFLTLARIYEASRLAVHPGWLRTGDRK